MRLAEHTPPLSQITRAKAQTSVHALLVLLARHALRSNAQKERIVETAKVALGTVTVMMVGGGILKVGNAPLHITSASTGQRGVVGAAR